MAKQRSIYRGSSGLLGQAASALAGSQSMTPKQMKELEEAVKGVAAAFERTKNAVTGWVTAGLAGTTMGERLTFQTQMLRREITQLFLPALEKVSEWLQKLINWFRQLTGVQQENLGKWLLSGTAMLGALVIMPKLVAGIEGLKTGWKTLSVVMAANPFLAAAAGVGVLLAQTSEGREQLQDIGTNLLEAFSTVATVLGDVLLPILETLSEFLSSGVGKVIIFAAVFVTAFRAMAAAAITLGTSIAASLGPIGLLIAAVGLLAAGIGTVERKQKEARFKDLADAVRRGQMTPEKAKEEAQSRIEADLAERERAIAKAAKGSPFRNLEEGLFEREKAKRQEEAAAQIDFAAARGKKPRNELLLAQTGQEDPRQTIQRIQTAALRVSDPSEKTAENTKELVELVRQILSGLPGGGNQDNRDPPPKDA